MVLGAVVGQVAEWFREHRQRPRPDAASSTEGAEGDADVPQPAEGERAIGGRLNPLNAAEDMLKRVIDHAQYRTDQTLRKGVEELRQATEQQWPLMAENAQLAADRAIELAGERLEGSSKRIAEDVAARTSLVIDEKLSRADVLLREHREKLVRGLRGLVLIGGAVVLVVGAVLIGLTAVLF